MEARLIQELPARPKIRSDEHYNLVFDAEPADAYMDALEAELARERERRQETQKERNTLQDDLFEMCKLCHQYQNELWTDAKIAASPAPAPVATGEGHDERGVTTGA